ncbi:MAG: M3 family metallopeptidase [Marinifilaceae bacterium]
MTALILTVASCNTKPTNPLLEEYRTLHNTPPFEQIEVTHYEPAFDVAIAEAQKEIEAIANQTAAPTFDNTIAAIDAAGERLGSISSIFFNLNSACTSLQMQQVAQSVSPKLTQYGNSIYMNPQLFERVATVYKQKNELNLNVEQISLLEDTYRSFVKGGANLTGDDKKRFEEISMELARLGLVFDENVLAETNAFELHVTNVDQLTGIPEGALEIAAQTAKEKGKDGWIFTLQAPSYIPFMKYADNRELREQMFRAYSSRGNKGNDHDNNNVVKEIVNLRLERSKIMGYNNYAEMALVDRMAQTPEQVNEFLGQLLEASHKHALADKKEVEDFAKRNGFSGELQRWDWSYYSNKLMQEKYALDDEMLKPYFKLENVQEGIFNLSTTLYGITFKEVANIPRYHDDVKTFEVYDENGEFLSVLLMDYFPRESKGGGAWMTEYRGQHIKDGENIRPIVSLVMNFTKPTATKPSLLTFDEVETFLHEFGHGLHGMLSQCTYNGTGGTNVYRDFVELPSQIMENWATEKEWLDQWAKHYETGESIPAEYIEKIKRSSNFQSGYLSDRQLSFGIIDMAWHSIEQPMTQSVSDFENETLKIIEMFPVVEGSNFSVGFGHIFGGGYAAGYYSYKWAEVLDADAFSVFKENGIFDKTTASSFRHNILEKGGSEHPMELYKKFRGHEPTVDALLERSGLN